MIDIPDDRDPLLDGAVTTPGVIGRPVYVLAAKKPKARVPHGPKPIATRGPKPIAQPGRDDPRQSREKRAKMPLADKEFKW
jgi:hypothetical protein